MKISPTIAPILRTWRLEDAAQTLVLAAQGDRLPCCIYWGPALPVDTDLATLWSAQAIDLTGGMLDANPDLSLCPQPGDSFPGQPGLRLRAMDGSLLSPRFRFASETRDGDALSLTCTDADLGLTLGFHLRITPETCMIEARTTLESAAPIHLSWLAAPVLPAPQQATGMLDFSGRWCGEFQLNRTPWTPGARLRENRTGRTGHEHFPGLILPLPGATNTRGEAYALHYGWSGGHRMVAEELPDGRRQIQFGNAPDTDLTPGTRFETAPLHATYSDAGLNGCAIAFQRHIRDHVVTWPNRKRPVHYNCWEAVYFDHKLPELKDIATRAAALGAERFVLDDGWFGKRDSDTTSLGDWQIDPRKYPDGLTPLIDHVQAQGMEFGLWIEPEMVNPESALYRAHPDWALGPADQTLGRQQMVLNMALPQVRAYLFDRISTLLSDNAIGYIKWDHNRVLPSPDAAQTRGTYDLLQRLRAAHPHVEIESCASGGGRIDAGILSYTQRVWLSDSNDALERQRLQHNAALFLPLAVTGSHVGPRHCHTSGRSLPMPLRAWTAAQRHMGFEMDPRELTEEEARVLTEVTSWWKTNRDWLTGADIHRLDSPDPAITAEQHCAPEASRFVTFAAKTATSTQIAPRPLRLTALDPAATYRVELITRDMLPALSRGTPRLKEGPAHLPGAWLMSHGLSLPWDFPDTIHVIEGQRL